MANLYCPLALQILLHYHTTPRKYAEHETAHAESPATRENLEMLLREDMLEPYEDRYRSTERGAFFIEHLMYIPFPERKWVMETRPTDEVTK